MSVISAVTMALLEAIRRAERPGRAPDGRHRREDAARPACEDRRVVCVGEYGNGCGFLGGMSARIHARASIGDGHER